MLQYIVCALIIQCFVDYFLVLHLTSCAKVCGRDEERLRYNCITLTGCLVFKKKKRYVIYLFK